jgi:hypothetical protein
MQANRLKNLFNLQLKSDIINRNIFPQIKQIFADLLPLALRSALY